MPRDKTASRKRVDAAIRAEFLEKGFDGASIRSIGARAGMTSAGLYRHYVSKEDMFDAMVEPLLSAIQEWTTRHKSKKYALVDNGAGKNDLFGESFIDFMRDIAIPRREEFRMLLCCAKGTKYENFIDDFVRANQQDFMQAIDYLRKRGFPVQDISEREVHMLMSAYVTACFEPIVHDYVDEDVFRYLKTIHEFFMPGWMAIMGIS